MTPPNTTFRPIPGDGACIVDRLRTTIPWLPPVWDKSFVVGEWRAAGGRVSVAHQEPAG